MAGKKVNDNSYYAGWVSIFLGGFSFFGTLIIGISLLIRAFASHAFDGTTTSPWSFLTSAVFTALYVWLGWSALRTAKSEDSLFYQNGLILIYLGIFEFATTIVDALFFDYTMYQHLGALWLALVAIFVTAIACLINAQFLLQGKTLFSAKQVRKWSLYGFLAGGACVVIFVILGIFNVSVHGPGDRTSILFHIEIIIFSIGLVLLFGGGDKVAF